MVRRVSLANEVVADLELSIGDIEAVLSGYRGRQISRVSLPEGVVDLVGVRVECLDDPEIILVVACRRHTACGCVIWDKIP